MRLILEVRKTAEAVVKIKPEKYNQACTGVEPMTSVIPVQSSNKCVNTPFLLTIIVRGVFGRLRRFFGRIFRT